MLCGLKQPRLVQASHRETYRVGALTFGEQGGSALHTEAASNAAVRAEPTYGTVHGNSVEWHQHARVKRGATCLLATAAMADSYIQRRGVAAIATCSA